MVDLINEGDCPDKIPSPSNQVRLANYLVSQLIKNINGVSQGPFIIDRDTHLFLKNVNRDLLQSRLNLFIEISFDFPLAVGAIDSRKLERVDQRALLFLHF